MVVVLVREAVFSVHDVHEGVRPFAAGEVVHAVAADQDVVAIAAAQHRRRGRVLHVLQDVVAVLVDVVDQFLPVEAHQFRQFIGVDVRADQDAVAVGAVGYRVWRVVDLSCACAAVQQVAVRVMQFGVQGDAVGLLEVVVG